MHNKIWTEEEFIQESDLGSFDRAKNIHLKTLDTLLKDYQCLAQDSFELEADKLLTICKVCKKYEAQKPVGHSGTAVMTLYAQALNRVTMLTRRQVTGHSLGHGQQGWGKVKAAVKPLLQGVAGSGGKAHHILDPFYWPEMIIEKHYPLAHPIFDNPSPFSAWKSSSTPLNFVDWLREVYIPNMIGTDIGQILSYKLNKGVTYLDSAQREDKKIHVKSGIIYNSRNERFHTGNMKTATMGKGWAIFVMAPDNSLYANNHKTDVFHHSSFLSGAAVQSAGEIAVDNGRVVALTSKSGHYCPNGGSFARLLYWLKQHGVNLTAIAACPVPTSQALKFYSAEEVWLKGGQPGTECVSPPKVLPKIELSQCQKIT